MTYTSDQQNAINKFQEFLNGNDQIFILKGYAGTGKTTIIKEFIHLSEEAGKLNILAAPTGRAALILQEKAEHEAATIHRTIYLHELTEINEGDEDEESSLRYYYPLKSIATTVETVIFVDESSMISSKESRAEIFRFGSGKLLADLLESGNLCNKGKIVFVGDPAQLPPVGDNKSLALSQDYLTGLGYSVVETEMTEIVRQDSQNSILKNATSIRDLMQQEKRNRLILDIVPDEFEHISDWDIVTNYVRLSPKPLMDSPVVICWTNADAAAYNTFIRKHYFSTSGIQTGDRVLIIANNYNKPRDIFNGEFAMITSASFQTTTLSAPVYCEENGEVKRKIIPLTYREVTLEFKDHIRINSYIIDTLLMNEKRDLTYEEMCSVHINFKMRHSHLKPGSQEYKAALRNDPFLNAIRIKFGYAITGHKSQGGEWDKTFVDFKGRTGLNDDSLRWSYTAITRARDMIYAANIPDINHFSKLKIPPPVKRSSIPVEAFSYGEVPMSPYHDTNTSPAIRAQYFGIESSLKANGYKIIVVQSFPYRERYKIESPEGQFYVCDGQYNKSMRLRFNSAIPEELYSIINSADDLYISYSYTPSTETLKALYDCMCGICKEHDITITNIVESPENYNVVYHLKTTYGTSSVTIYWDKDDFITNTITASDNTEDPKLNLLLQELSSL